MREKYQRVYAHNFLAGNRQIGSRQISLRKDAMAFGSRIATSLGGVGSRIDVWYDATTSVLSFSKGKTLLLFSMNHGAKTKPSCNCSSVGFLKKFGITHRGRLEARWNESQESWDVSIPF